MRGGGPTLHASRFQSRGRLPMAGAESGGFVVEAARCCEACGVVFRNPRPRAAAYTAEFGARVHARQETLVDLVTAAGFATEARTGYRYFRYLQMLPVARAVFGAVYPAVEAWLESIGTQRFAYNLILRCTPVA